MTNHRHGVVCALTQAISYLYTYCCRSVGSQAGVGHFAERPGPASGFGPKPKGGRAAANLLQLWRLSGSDGVVLMRGGVLLKVHHPSPHEAFYYVLTPS
jgi:hypothetical protein